MNLFEKSFLDIYRFATQNLIFKMEVLEAFIIRQVGLPSQHNSMQTVPISLSVSIQADSYKLIF